MLQKPVPLSAHTDAGGPAIFPQFRREDVQQTGEGRGLGVGLAVKIDICHRIQICGGVQRPKRIVLCDGVQKKFPPFGQIIHRRTV